MAILVRPRTAASAALGIAFLAVNTNFVGVDAFSYLDSLNGGNSGAVGLAPPPVASPPQGRVPILAGNWKLNPASLSDAAALCQGLAANVADAGRVEVVVFPPFPYLSTAKTMLEGTGIKVGAQNCALQTSGAHTGEVAVSMIRSLGCDYVLLGHSERRSIYGETEADINAKVHLCLQEDPGLGIILCVGETEEEYDSGLLRSIVDVQIKKGLSKVNQGDLSRIVIAYEPVWAIGTGKVATPEQAQIAHEAVRQTLADMFGAAASQAVRVQYGGSVTPDSIDSLMIMPDVDGALVGGASLSAESFARIVEGGAASSY
jgi:triosephosphate isomerase